MTIDQLKEQQAELDARYRQIQDQLRIDNEKAQKALNEIQAEFLKNEGKIELLTEQAK